MTWVSDYRELWIGIGLFIVSLIVVFIISAKSDDWKWDADVGFVKKAFVGKSDADVDKDHGRCPVDEKNKAAACADNYYCEAIRNGLIKQPASTLGTFGFIIVGLIILARVGWERDNNVQPVAMNRMTSPDSRFYPAMYGLAVVWMGPGSMMLHATMTAIGGFLDGISMYFWAHSF